MQGSARKDVVFGAVRGYPFTVPGPKMEILVQCMGNRECGRVPTLLMSSFAASSSAR